MTFSRSKWDSQIPAPCFLWLIVTMLASTFDNGKVDMSNGTSDQESDPQPSKEMLEPIEKIARFLETTDNAYLAGFTDQGVTIIENFPPYKFDGNNAVALWAKEMRKHVEPIAGLKHRFGTVQTFSTDGQTAYLSIPTNWSGVLDGHRFDEDGGWAFTIVKQSNGWCVRDYAWAVTELRSQALPPA